jgi:metal-sulfur cluster biosynthetic enzyme
MESNIDPTIGAEIADGTVVTVESATAPVVTADAARAVLRGVKDPDLNLNIVDLGLVYDVRVDGSVVTVDMTLTSPGCPSGPEIMGEAERQLRLLSGVTDVRMNLVWTPFWSPDRIEPKVRAYMGI